MPEWAVIVATFLVGLVVIAIVASAIAIPIEAIKRRDRKDE